MHDVGGHERFGAIDISDDGAPFHHEWEARVFAINRTLLARGLYNLDEFRRTVEQIDPAVFESATYYERWLIAIESLIARKGLNADV